MITFGEDPAMMKMITLDQRHILEQRIQSLLHHYFTGEEQASCEQEYCEYSELVMDEPVFVESTYCDAPAIRVTIDFRCRNEPTRTGRLLYIVDYELNDLEDFFNPR